MTRQKLNRTNAPKATGRVPDDTVMQAEAEPAVEIVAAEPVGSIDELPTMSREAKGLLDRAVQTAIKNKGVNLDDVNAKARLESQSTLLEATDGNVAIACMAIMESPTPDDLLKTDRRGARAFSLLYNVMRSVIFLSNGAYRRWLDPRPNYTQPAADWQETKEAPWGLAPESEDENFEVTLEIAVDEIASWFGAMVQICGFSLDGGDAGSPNNLNGAFPLAYAVRPDNTLEPITSFHRAVDLVEQKRQASLSRRAAAERLAYGDAALRALELMAKLQSKTKDGAKA